MLRHIASELKEHIPFTAVGAVTGIILMVIIVLVNVPAQISQGAFNIFHPLHVLLSAMVTTAMFRKYKGGKIWIALAIGYSGSVGIATLSDSVIPYLGGALLGADMEFHVGFIEEWWLVNPLALIGIIIGYMRPATKSPHFGHVLLSTWASLFYFTAFGVAQWLPVLPLIFLFLFFAVWLPCCISDIIFPLLFTGNIARTGGIIYNQQHEGGK
ncbi:hypothetical protein ACFLYF_02245 [Chloroflexota bacterium]